MATADLLTPRGEESAKLVRLARVAERAEEAFEVADAALDWLKSPWNHRKATESNGKGPGSNCWIAADGDGYRMG